MVKESTCNSRDRDKKNIETLFWVEPYPWGKNGIEILRLTNSQHGFICHGVFTEVFANKCPSSQGYGFSSSHMWMWELDYKERWVPIDAFELWCWRRLLRVPWTARRSIQSILKEISPDCSLERLVLKLKLQYFGHLMRRADSFEKTLTLERLRVGGEGDHRGWDSWMASLTRWTWVWVNSGSWWWAGRSRMLRFMGLQRVGHDWATELNWTLQR